MHAVVYMSQDTNPLAFYSNKRNSLLPAKFYSPFFLIYVFYYYRQHKTSPGFTYSITINTKPNHMALYFHSPFFVTEYKSQDLKLTDIRRSTAQSMVNRSTVL